MVNVKKVVAALGIAAGIGAAIIPAVTFADDELTATDTLDVNVNVAAVISMRLESHSDLNTGTRTTNCYSNDPDGSGPLTAGCTDTDIDDDGVGDNNEVHTTLLPASADTTTMYTNVYVTTNCGSGYTLTLIDSDNNNNLSTATASIAPISSLPVASTNPGWAIHIDGDVDSNTGADIWRAMPAASGSPIVVKNTSATHDVVNQDLSKVTYGVATASDQATGTYTDTVVYTATTK